MTTAREHLLKQYQESVRKHNEMSQRLKDSLFSIAIFYAVGKEKATLEHSYMLSEMHINALQSVGQLIGEILRKIDDDSCLFPHTPLTQTLSRRHTARSTSSTPAKRLNPASFARAPAWRLTYRPTPLCAPSRERWILPCSIC